MQHFAVDDRRHYPPFELIDSLGGGDDDAGTTGMAPACPAATARSSAMPFEIDRLAATSRPRS
jgi:hypothetical protein